jgi:hypothetical protein
MNFSAMIFSLALIQAPAPTAHDLTTDLPTGFLPEGVEWDAAHSRFLISSIREHRIASIDPASGHATEFADAPGSVLGLHIDAHTGIVWAAWTQFAHEFKANKGTGISAWSTKDARHLGDWPLPGTDPLVNFGDLAIIDSHTIVASDSGTGAIWRFDTKTHRYTNVVPAGKFKNPQGLVPGHQVGTIYLADYPTGLWRVSFKDGSATQLAAPAGSEIRGIDGIYRYRNDLITIQNGTKTPRVLVIRLDNKDAIVDVRRWLELPGAEIDLGTLTNDAFWFIANGKWNEYDDDLAPKPGAKFEAPRLHALPLADLANKH